MTSYVYKDELKKRGFNSAGIDWLYTDKNGNHVEFTRTTVILRSFAGYYYPSKMEGEWPIWDIGQFLECLDIFLEF